MVIFDCNGVLVDSEPLATTIASQEFMRAGFPLTPDMIARFSIMPVACWTLGSARMLRADADKWVTESRPGPGHRRAAGSGCRR